MDNINLFFSIWSETWIPHLLKVLLLLLWVGVVKAHDECAFKRHLIVLVEQGSLGMTDMQVAGHREAEKEPPMKGKYSIAILTQFKYVGSVYGHTQM